MRRIVAVTLAVFALFISFAAPSSATPHAAPQTAAVNASSWTPCKSSAQTNVSWTTSGDRKFSRTSGFCLKDGFWDVRFQTDCNLVLYSEVLDDLTAHWASKTNKIGAGCYLLLAKSGNIDVYDHNNVVRWTTNARNQELTLAYAAYFDWGFIFLGPTSYAPDCPEYGNESMVTAKGFKYDHNPKVSDFKYPYSMSTDPVHNTTQLCNQITDR